MSRRVLTQKVVGTVNVCGRTYISEEIDGVSDKNVRSKITKWLDNQCIKWETSGGVEIIIKMEPCEKDEYNRPDPE